MNNKGFFIAFEGNDGAGKSTVSRDIYDSIVTIYPNTTFLDKNHPVLESGYGMYHMGKIREILWDYDISAPLDELGDSHWLLLLSSWFAALDYGIIKPALNEGKIIISDGWFYKYIARFSLKNDIMRNIANEVFNLSTEPDLTIYLDVTPRVAATRKETLKPSESGMLENDKNLNFSSYQQLVREQYSKFFNDKWIHMNTTDLSPEYLKVHIIEIIKSNLEKQK
ncbi:dTMP kinase [Musicola paradisiaca]|uniref:Thymidylate kinase n=1 Tax=Musicola paradisiaca (strain Ech703) TaxID=579405 RepID=C6CBI4_MUSP7|nr:thymidylate kinase [Musicola paradisiaca]ACS84769.1 thymidylate kinase [Musicola paradisiaca Ech703]